MSNVLETQLGEEEEIEFADTCKLTPFLLRVCPLYPDVLIKKAVLALTQQRLIMLHLKAMGNAVKSVESIPLEEIDSLETNRGLFTSKLVVLRRDGRKTVFHSLSHDVADGLKKRFDEIRSAAE